MNRKIKVIFLAMIICTGFFMVFHKSIERRLFYNKESKRLVNYYNDIKSNEFLDKSNKYYKHLHGYINDKMDITDAINNYFDIMIKCINNKIEGKLIRYNSFAYAGNYEKPKMYGLKDSEAKKIVNLLEEDDIFLYKQGLLIDKLSNKLLENSVIKHESDNVYKGWYITNDKDCIIDLPYNIYIKYSCDKIQINNSLKKILNIHIYDKHNYKMCNIKYETIDGSIQEMKEELVFVDNNSQQLTIPSIENLFFESYQKASLTFGQHDYDEAEKKKNSISDETPQVVWTEEETRIHEETKYIFDGAAFILLMHYLDTDKWEYRFRMFYPDKTGHVKGFNLPYKDKMTIDEAIEKFLNDKKLVKKALALWDIDIDKIGEDEIIDKIKENTIKAFQK